jgi:hypothetical protein
MLSTDPALPMERIEPALPMERIEPVLPMLRIEPKLPMLRTDPKLNMLPTLKALKRLDGLRKLSELLALNSPARPPVPARDSARFLFKRTDLRMVASSVLAHPTSSRQFSSIASDPADPLCVKECS